MQLPNAVYDYSDFFKSGFRAFTNRGSAGAASSHNYLSGSPDVTLYTSPLTLRTTLTPRGRPRPVSMAFGDTPREKARRRWSSFLSLPTHLFDRKSATTSFDKWSTTSSTSSTSSYAFDSGDSGLWKTSGGPHTLSAQNRSSDDLAFPLSIDSLSSSPDAKSTFIDFSQDDPVSDISKCDSFISFTSSSNRSSLLITRRERPSSIQTRPPLPSRRSSLQCYQYPLGQEKSDSSWMVEDGYDLISSEVLEVELEDPDAPAKIDWRQFHVDILTDDM